VNLTDFKNKKILVVYGGGFHPVTPHHLYVWNQLNKMFPTADVFMASSDNSLERPFSFKAKQFLATQAGIPTNQFVETTNPCSAQEITSKYDPANTIFLTAVSSKDKDRFGSGKKKDGSLSYIQPFISIGKCLTMNKHCYYVVIDAVSTKIDGHDISSASQIRDLYVHSDHKEKLLKELYPRSSKISEIKRVFDDALGNVNESIIGYHGTRHGGFEAFKMPESTLTLSSALGAGLYFTNDKKFAKSYTNKSDIHSGVATKKQVYTCDLTLDNALYLSHRSHVVTKEQFAELIKHGDRAWFFTNWVGFYLDKPNTEATPKMIDEYIERLFKSVHFDGDGVLLSEVTRAYKSASSCCAEMKRVFGADGIIYTENTGIEVYVVWDVNNIQIIPDKKTKSKNAVTEDKKVKRIKPKNMIDCATCQGTGFTKGIMKDGKTTYAKRCWVCHGEGSLVPFSGPDHAQRASGA